MGLGPHGQYSSPLAIPAGTPFELTGGRRGDLIFQPTAPGAYQVKVEYLDWVTRRVWGTARTFVNVAP